MNIMGIEMVVLWGRISCAAAVVGSGGVVGVCIDGVVVGRGAESGGVDDGISRPFARQSLFAARRFCAAFRQVLRVV